MNYEFRQFELANGIKGISVIFEGAENKKLSTFFQTEVSNFSSVILDMINSVLNGEANEKIFNGNVCGATINGDVTHVFNALDDYEDEYGMCEIETDELKRIIEEYVEMCEAM